MALRLVRPERRATGARCELCRRVSDHLRETECCGRMVCMVLLSDGWSLSKSSCLIKHGRFTLCGAHHAERHGGDWKSCEVCPKTWPLEMYVWYGTNKWNFEKLENPPSYEPTHCAGCGRVIVLSKDGYSRDPAGSHRCVNCWED